MITTTSYPRAALIGNPSDGYFGKTIAFVFKNFQAEVKISESDQLEIIPNDQDRLVYSNIGSFSDSIKNRGYYGGLRLIKASIKRFYDYTQKQSILLHHRNFTIRYQSTIPMQVGLAGSSAIITATMKALLQFYQVEIPKPKLANLILAVETEELGIAAGLQDRVAQVYEQPIYMDFNQKQMQQERHGYYECFSADLLPSLYIAFRKTTAEDSDIVHSNLKQRFENGDAAVHSAMQQFAKLTDLAYAAIKNKEADKLSNLMDQNYDLRASICSINATQQEMIRLAREIGVSAKFTGSGGAIIGICKSEIQYNRLKAHLQKSGIEVMKPQIVRHE